MNMKKIVSVVAVGMLAVGMMFVREVRADSNTSNDTAQIMVTISPYTDRGVAISSGEVTLNLGAVELNKVAQVVKPATVTIQGSLTNTDLNLSADITGGWMFEDTATSSATDHLKAWVCFTATTVDSMPSKDETNSIFDNTNDLVSTDASSYGAARVGGSNRFEDLSTDMNGMVPGDKRHMWLYFATPDVTTVSTDQLIRFNLTAIDGL